MKKLCLLLIIALSATGISYGQVGIGTTAPTQQLELTQSLKFPPTTSNVTGIIFKGDYPFLHDYKGAIALGYNTFLGVNAGNLTSGGTSNYLGCNNTGIGYWSLNAVTTGYANTAVGAFSLPSVTTGYENTAAGLQSLYMNTTGLRNTAAGYMAGHENSGGSNNTLMGYSANYNNQTGGNNTIIGYEAGRGTALHNKSGNIFIGYQAGYNETGSNKLYIDNSSTSSPLIGGDFSTNVACVNGSLGVGTSSPAATLHVAGTIRIADGSQGTGRMLISDVNGTATWADQPSVNDGDWIISGANMYSNVAGNVGIGVTAPAQQLEITAAMRMPATTSSTTGVIYKGTSPFLHNYKGTYALGYNTFLGVNAGNFTSGGINDYQGCNNTGVGEGALSGLTTGYANTGVGAFVMPSTTSGVENTAMGLQALYANLGGGRNIAIGYMAGHENTSGGSNTVMGYNANYYNQTGSNNTIIGYEAGKGGSVHNKSGNIFLGYMAGINETGSNKLYIENSGSTSPLIGGDFSTDVAFVSGKLGIGTSAPATSALLDLNSTTTGLLLPRMTTAQRTAISGPTDGLLVYDTDIDAVYIYRNGVWSPELNGSSGWSLTGNSGISASANFIGTTDAVALKFRINNTHAGILEPAYYNAGFGYLSLANVSSGQQNTAIGYRSLEGITTGSVNVAVGSFTGTAATNSNTISLGYDAYADASNRAEIGNTLITWIGGQVNWSTYSDGRAKRNISENIPGLDFILQLRPVTYQYDLERLNEIRGRSFPADAPSWMDQARKDQESRVYTGFIAQEVEVAAKKCGFNFSGVQAPVNEHTPYSLSYAEFVVPLVKAMQEQQETIEMLMKRIEELEKKLKIEN